MTTLTPKTSLRPMPYLVAKACPAPAVAPAPLSVAQVVLTAAREVEESTLHRVARSNAGVAFQPKTLLIVMTYCYACKVYGSADIEDAMRRDPVFRKLCQDEFPRPGVFRRFRRHNRNALHTCLTRTLEQLARQENHTRADDAPDYLAEAADRINTATIMDCIDDDSE